MEALIGALGGGIFRMLPELLKWFDRKDERKHEINMFGLQLEADKLKGAQALAQTQAEADASIGVAELQALIEATQAQAVTTGVKWVDAISLLMRPLITFWWVIIMYSSALVLQYQVLLVQGVSRADAALTLWGADEKAICASIISFWFVDRSLRRGFSK